MAKANATTPQPPEINSLLAEMAENGCRAAVIEVSSQGLMHSRIDGIDIDIGAGSYTHLDVYKRQPLFVMI